MRQPSGNPFIFPSERQLHSGDVGIPPSSARTVLGRKQSRVSVQEDCYTVSPAFFEHNEFFSSAKRIFGCCSLGRVLKCSFCPETAQLRCLKSIHLTQRQNLFPVIGEFLHPAVHLTLTTHFALSDVAETGHKHFLHKVSMVVLCVWTMTQFVPLLPLRVYSAPH